MIYFLFAMNSVWFAVIVSVFLDWFVGLYVWLFCLFGVTLFCCIICLMVR